MLTDVQQTEYTLAIALTFTCVFLGLLLVCIPRPRASELPEDIAKKKKRRRSPQKK